MPTVPADPSLDVPPELLEAWERHPAIVKYGDPVLRKPARPVTRFNAETTRLIKRMVQIMRDAKGLGLAAPQIGESTRIIIYDADEKDGLRVIVNPTILSRSGEQTEPKEGCLSIPGLQGVVKRANELKVRGYDERNRPVARRVKGLEARVIQHEIDHLDGILFIDRAEEGTLEWAFGDDDEDETAAKAE
ncbi:MAG TPA: peptide deformylase [Chthonomonadaceae bacterium]|nr:peptide deformylase [Chthonomonadaceae bacterium]